MKLKKIFVFLISIQLFSCSSSSIGRDYSWEGIKGSTLNIYVYELILSEEFDESEKSRKLLMERGCDRATLIMASYISLNMRREKADANTDALLNKIMQKIIENGRMNYIDCPDSGFCSSSIKFNISELLSAIDRINNNQ